jgi:hypothetical protein
MPSFQFKNTSLLEFTTNIQNLIQPLSINIKTLNGVSSNKNRIRSVRKISRVYNTNVSMRFWTSVTCACVLLWNVKRYWFCNFIGQLDCTRHWKTKNYRQT